MGVGGVVGLMLLKKRFGYILYLESLIVMVSFRFYLFFLK